jgi:CRP-like cAMP-binding protein
MMSSTARRQFLARAPLFAGLSPEALHELARRSTDRRVSAGDKIFSLGDESKSVLVLTEGLVKTVINLGPERQITLRLLEPVAVIGEIGAFDGSRRSATLVAIRRSEYIAIPVEIFDGLFDADEGFARTFARHLASVVRRTNEHLVMVATGIVELRLAWCLCRLAGDRGFVRDGGRVIRPAPTHQALAGIVGSTRPTVTKAMRGLMDAGHVKSVSDGLYVDASIETVLAAGHFPIGTFP